MPTGVGHRGHRPPPVWGSGKAWWACLWSKAPLSTWSEVFPPSPGLEPQGPPPPALLASLAGVPVLGHSPRPLGLFLGTPSHASPVQPLASLVLSTCPLPAPPRPPLRGPPLQDRIWVPLPVGRGGGPRSCGKGRAQARPLLGPLCSLGPRAERALRARASELWGQRDPREAGQGGEQACEGMGPWGGCQGLGHGEAAGRCSMMGMM